MIVKMKNGDISQISEEEKQAYIDYAKKKYPDEIIDEIIIKLDGEFVDLEIHKHSVPFRPHPSYHRLFSLGSESLEWC